MIMTNTYFTDKFLEHLSNKLRRNEIDQILKDNYELLNSCVDPTKFTKQKNTVLAIGKIQSGKTASMEALSNFARDRGFKLIILISGTVGVLTKQTQKRIYESINGFGWQRLFIPSTNDGSTEYSAEETPAHLARKLNSWHNDLFKNEEKQAAFILSMKGHYRLRRLIRLLRTLSSSINMEEIPSLIIDDECDHYSLNTLAAEEIEMEQGEEYEDEEGRQRMFIRIQREYTVAELSSEYNIEIAKLIAMNPKLEINETSKIPRGESIQIASRESLTHSLIKTIRNLLPNHSYIGYTATPQAPLLISTLDHLSPDKHQIIKPGSNYCGVNYYFPDGPNRSNHIQMISVEELRRLNDENEMPHSLKTSIMQFIIGIAKKVYNNKHLSKDGDAISMMIHPGGETSIEDENFSSHENILALVENYLNSLINIFEKKDQEKENFDELLKLFLVIYKDLKSTDHLNESPLPDFQNLITSIEKSLYFIEIIEFNARSSRSIPNINWYSEGFARILVGGVGLGRGYTVEGLIVSYMCRNMSQQEDTSFQRARFFGYPPKDKGLIRIWLTEHSIRSFEHLRESENFMWSHFENWGEASLKEMPRLFWEDEENFFRPTKRSVMGFRRANIRRNFDIIRDQRSHLLTENEISERRDLYNKFADSDIKDISEIINREGYEHLKHKYTNQFSCREIISLLKKIPFYSSDAFNYHAALFILDRHLEDNPDLMCSVIMMNDRSSTGRKLFRGMVDSSQHIVIHSSSEDPTRQDWTVNYEFLNSPDKSNESYLPERIPTLQVYNFNVYPKTNPDLNKDSPIKEDVPYFVLFLPGSARRERVIPYIED